MPERRSQQRQRARTPQERAEDARNVQVRLKEEAAERRRVADAAKDKPPRKS